MDTQCRHDGGCWSSYRRIYRHANELTHRAASAAVVGPAAVFYIEMLLHGATEPPRSKTAGPAAVFYIEMLLQRPQSRLGGGCWSSCRILYRNAITAATEPPPSKTAGPAAVFFIEMLLQRPQSCLGRALLVQLPYFK